MADERLQKILSRAGISSRRAAEDLILAGRVQVNGKVVRELGSRADPRHDMIRVDDRVIAEPEALVYYLLYKPERVVTTLSDPEGRDAVGDLLRRLAERVYPVGRLDYDAEGVLLLTNDGDLAHKLTHPRWGVPRTYLAKVKGEPSDEVLARLKAGVRLEDGMARAVEATFEKKTYRNTWIRLVVTEGRHHLVKRMCDAVNHPVVRLFRSDYAGVTAAGLQPGEVRPLTKSELQTLKKAVEKEAPAPPGGRRRKPTRLGGGAVRNPVLGTARRDGAGSRFAGAPSNFRRAGEFGGRDERPASGGRPGFGRDERPSSGGRPAFGGDERPSSGGRPAFGRDERPSSGGRPAFGREERPSSGGRPALGRDERPSSGGRPAFGRDERPSSGGRPGFGRDERPSSGGRPGFGRDERPSSGGRPGFSRGERPASGGRPTFGRGERPASGGRPGFSRDERPASGDRPAFGRDERPSSGGRPGFSRGERPASGGRPTFGRDERPASGDRPTFSRGERFASGGRPTFGRGERPASGGRPAFGRGEGFEKEPGRGDAERPSRGPPAGAPPRGGPRGPRSHSGRPARAPGGGGARPAGGPPRGGANRNPRRGS